MNKYFVLEEVICPKCKGKKIITHPCWVTFLEQAPENYDNYYKENWFYKNTHFHWDDIPPEKIECLECKGVGILFVKVPLPEALGKISCLASWGREQGKDFSHEGHEEHY